MLVGGISKLKKVEIIIDFLIEIFVNKLWVRLNIGK